jgi:hypothetical protein
MESPYDRDFVEGLKLHIDYGGRSWDPARKRWIVSALYTDVLLGYLTQVGAQVQDDRAPQAQALAAVPAMPAELKTAFDELYLAYTAPLCVAEGSYRALSKYFHPDKGGDVRQFQQVNDAIQVVRRYLDPKDDDLDADIPF